MCKRCVTHAYFETRVGYGSRLTHPTNALLQLVQDLSKIRVNSTMLLTACGFPDIGGDTL